LDPPGIILIHFGSFEHEVINWISEDISDAFGYPLEAMECSRDLSEYYSPGRRQYDANSILRVVSELSPPGAVKTIGLLKVDLFIPILTFIFGQARLNGDAGIASLYRLRNELYGLKQNYMLQFSRLRKVAIHELGHTFGLIHCYNDGCVMRSSTYVEDIDQKSIRFCRSCRTELERRRIEGSGGTGE
jgi:archaemetzincin